MPLTLAEKLISQKVGREVRAGEVVVSPVDVAFAQDGTGPLAVRQIEALGIERLARPILAPLRCHERSGYLAAGQVLQRPMQSAERVAMRRRS